jgi:hypothetical protein
LWPHADFSVDVVEGFKNASFQGLVGGITLTNVLAGYYTDWPHREQVFSGLATFGHGAARYNFGLRRLDC